MAGVSRRASRLAREPYAWLGAGAITLGLGAATLASSSGVAHADASGSGGAGPSNHVKSQAAVRNGTSGAVSKRASGPHAASFNPQRPGTPAASTTVLNTTTSTAAAATSSSTTGDSNYGTYKTIDLGGTPTNVALSANGGRAFVVVDGSLKIVEIGSSGPVVSGTVTVGSDPNTVAANANGTLAYVTNSGSGTVSVVTTTSTSATPAVTSVAVGNNPTGIAVNSTGNRAYVANSGSGTISIIDYGTSLPLALPTSPTVTTISVGSDPTSIATNSAGTIAYVTNSGGNTVSIIKYNGQGTPTVTDVQVSTSPTSVKTSDAGTTAIVYSSGGIISIINASGAKPTVATVPGAHVSYDDYPGFVAISSDGKTAFVTEHDANQVAIINTATPTVDPTFSNFDDYPHSIVALRNGALAFTVAHDALYVIDAKTGQAAPVSIPADNNSSESQRLAISSDGSRVIAVDNSGDLTAFYYASSDGTSNAIDGTIHTWLRSLGTTFEDLNYLAENHALKGLKGLGAIGLGLGISDVLGYFGEQQYGEGFYQGVQLVAGELEWAGTSGLWPAAIAGVFLDTTSYAIHDIVNNPPADLTTVGNYVVNHPAGAVAGAVNGVIGLEANTVGHFVPEVAVQAVVNPIMDFNNTVGDAVDTGLHNVANGIQDGINTVSSWLPHF